MSAVDWVFAALCTLAALLLSGWLDVPVAVGRAASRVHRPHLPQWMRNGYARLRVRHTRRSGR
jgi:hypothetical protein